MTSSSAAGSAEDAKVSTGSGSEQPTNVELARDAVEAAQAKVDKQKAHLDGARAALKDAKAALSAAKKE